MDSLFLVLFIEEKHSIVIVDHLKKVRRPTKKRKLCTDYQPNFCLFTESKVLDSYIRDLARTDEITLKLCSYLKHLR